MRVNFSYKIVDRKGNKIFWSNRIKDIDISTKGEVYFGVTEFTKNETNKSIHPGGSLNIVWQIEYFDNLCDLKALHCAENDCQKVKF